MLSERSDPLVSTDWLAAHLRDPALRVIDASWHMQMTGRSAGAEFLQRRIPGAVYFDIDAVADGASDLPHMVPAAADFARHVGAMGVDNDMHVVCYDASAVFSAARCWWMFRLFGHDRVSVLDGGFAKWQAEGRPVDSGPPSAPPQATFQPRLRRELLRDAGEMLRNIGRQPVLDARSPGRFAGLEPEPRPDLRAGHIPAARNLHYAALMDPQTGCMRPVRELRPLFAAALGERTPPPDAPPVVCSCGSGITACVLALGLRRIGRAAAVYDGSWTEWGKRADLPVER